MTSPFRDQEKFMNACDQTTSAYNKDQYNMYIGLIQEEHDELQVAIDANDRVEQLDALIDILVVLPLVLSIALALMPKVRGRKLCQQTLPRLIEKPARFANVKMGRCSNH